MKTLTHKQMRELASLYRAYSRNRSEIVLVDVIRLSSELVASGVEFMFLNHCTILDLTNGEVIKLGAA